MSKLCCTTWPQLTMVMCTHVVNLNHLKLSNRLSAEWECMVDIESGVWPFGGRRTPRTAHSSAVLVRARQQLHIPPNHISRQHHAALSAFADMNKRNKSLTLQGPLGCCAFQSLTCDCWPQLKLLRVVHSPNLGLRSRPHLNELLPSLKIISISHCCLDASDILQLSTGWPHIQDISLCSNQLDASKISAMAQANWPNLSKMSLCCNTLDRAGMQHLVSCSWPSLRFLNLTHACLDASALHCLAQGKWPVLSWLDLSGNNINARGISFLVRGSWPLLETLRLSDQGLDEEACSLLGVTNVDISRARITAPRKAALMCPRIFRCCSYLPQFPHSTLQICQD